MASVDPTAVLLQALVSGPGHGLELLDRICRKTSGQVRFTQGTVYLTLRTMTQRGLVDVVMGTSKKGTGGRPPRLFKLTSKGMKAAMEARKNAGGLFGIEPSSPLEKKS